MAQRVFGFWTPRNLYLPLMYLGPFCVIRVCYSPRIRDCQNFLLVTPPDLKTSGISSPLIRILRCLKLLHDYFIFSQRVSLPLYHGEEEYGENNPSCQLFFGPFLTNGPSKWHSNLNTRINFSKIQPLFYTLDSKFLNF